MAREVKTIVLTVLTFLFFAVSIYLDKGALIFPFPIKEILFCCIALQFSFWNRQQRWPSIIASLTGICGMLSSQFTWSFFLNAMELESFIGSSTHLFIQFLFISLLLLSGVLISLKQKKGFNHLLTLLFIGTLLYGHYSTSPLFTAVSFLIMVISTQIKPVFKPFHLLWVLLFSLEASHVLSSVLN